MTRSDTEQSLAGRRALMTGAASGIGAACSSALAERGADLLLIDRDHHKLDELARSLGPGAEAVPLDLAVDGAVEGLGPLEVDILVNNAGFQVVAELRDFPVSSFRDLYRVMVETPFLLIQAAFPHMAEHRFGRIVNMSSVHGRRASRFKVGYVAAKHALEGLSKVVALEGAEFDITSNCVSPGFVRTPLVSDQVRAQAELHELDEASVLEQVILQRAAIKRLVEPSDVADLVAWLCGPTASAVTGASFAMDGGWSVS